MLRRTATTLTLTLARRTLTTRAAATIPQASATRPAERERPLVPRHHCAIAPNTQREHTPATMSNSPLPASTVVGFIGGGAMASAIAQGIVRAKLLPAAQLCVSDPNPRALESLASAGIRVTGDNRVSARSASVLFLCTKPAAAAPALAAVASDLRSDTLVISIAAGLSLAALEAAAPSARIVRVMPNTPSLVGQGASAFALGSKCTPDDQRVVQTLLESFGTAVSVPESYLSGVTGLSGSGPAYVFLFVESLADGGVRAGLPRAIAHQLAVQTVLGSAKLLAGSGTHPAVLKDQVASPGGTTIAGIHALESGSFRSTVMDAVLQAATRAKEMGQEADQQQTRSKLKSVRVMPRHRLLRRVGQAPSSSSTGADSSSDADSLTSVSSSSASIVTAASSTGSTEASTSDLAVRPKPPQPHLLCRPSSSSSSSSRVIDICFVIGIDRGCLEHEFNP